MLRSLTRIISSVHNTADLPPTALDLFCGAGGVTTGFEAAGIQVLAAVDTDEVAGETYKVNHPGVRFYAEDVHDLSPAKLRRRIRLCKGALTILTACTPCQTFSTLGAKNRRGRDRRSGLVGRVIDFVAEFEPRAVVMENVPLLAADIRFANAVRRLRKLGYGVWHGVVNAADFGVPQRRRRLVVFAMRGAPDADVPALSTAHPQLLGFRGTRTVREAFALLAEAGGQLGDDPLSVPRLKYPDIVARRIAAIPLAM